MKKISVALDFKNNSFELLQTGVKWCKKLSADLNIIHVDRENTIDFHNPFNLTNPYNSEEEILQEKINADIIAQSKKRLEELLSLVDLSGINVSHTFSVGDVDKQLVKAIVKEKPDLLIMSITNDLDTDHFEPTTLLRILEDINTTVLAIPSDYADYSIKKIVFAYDKENEYLNNLNASRELAAALDTPIYNVKVFNNEIDYRDYVQKESWQDSNYDFCFACPNPYSGLIGFYNGIDGDLLVLTHEHRNFISQFFHDSMTKQFLQDAKIPLLIFDGDIKDWNLL